MRALSLLLVCGCFGTGPEPTEATEAELLFTLPLGPIVADDCQLTRYIGNVAFGDTHGYAITHTYLPACSNGGGGGGGDQGIPAFVLEFPKAGGTARLVDNNAGNTGLSPGRPRIAAFGSDAVWALTPMQGATETEVRSLSGNISGRFGSTARGASGLVVDNNNTFIASTDGSTGGSTQPNDPRYPCCGGGGGNPQPTINVFVAIPSTQNVTTPTTIAGTPQFVCEHLKDCLVGNANALFYLERPQSGSNFAVARRPRDAATAPTQLATLVTGRPAGLAASATHVAWSLTREFTPIPVGEPPERCTIFQTAADAMPGAELRVLDTDRFSCLDVALDDTHIYFTIVALGEFEDQSEEILVNLGVGRVPLAGGTPETLALGITGPHVAPRQVFVDGDDLFLVAPFAVAKIRKAALAGRTDVAF